MRMNIDNINVEIVLYKTNEKYHLCETNIMSQRALKAYSRIILAYFIFT